MNATIYRERLELLATHLEGGKLGHEEFYFSSYNATRDFEPAGHKCGTLGCALGECPIVWPDDWKFRKYDVGLLSEGGCTPIPAAMVWFCLDGDEVAHLFYPRAQAPERFGGSVLTGEASRYQVATNIREFIKRKYPTP